MQSGKSKGPSARNRRISMRINIMRLALYACLLALCALLLALSLSAQAQQPTKISRIGYLGATSLSSTSARIEAFQQGLRELGYVAGKNIVIEWRWAEGKFDRLPDLAAE